MKLFFLVPVVFKASGIQLQSILIIRIKLITLMDQINQYRSNYFWNRSHGIWGQTFAGIGLYWPWLRLARAMVSFSFYHFCGWNFKQFFFQMNMEKIDAGLRWQVPEINKWWSDGTVYINRQTASYLDVSEFYISMDPNSAKNRNSRVVFKIIALIVGLF